MPNKVGQGFFINLATTGAVAAREKNRFLPVHHGEIIENVAACLELGVQMFHLHARDAQGFHTCDPEPYGRLIEDIRRLPGGEDAVLCVTTSGRQQPDFAFRSRVLDLDGDMKPDMASLTTSSLNLFRAPNVNSPEVIRLLAERMAARLIRPELEIFDIGGAHYARLMAQEGVLKPPFYANVLLGNTAGAHATPVDLAAVLAAIPGDCVTAIAGLGHFQLSANVLGLVFTDGVRVGLEDNIWYDTRKTILASNISLVRRILRLADELDRPLMTRRSLRSILRLD